MAERVVIVTGSRDWTNEALIVRKLEEAMPLLLVEGGARGADAIARRWAARVGVKRVTFRADWERYGKAAGMIRNREMLAAFPEAHVLAFPLDGPGTKHCIAQARKFGMAVNVYAPDGTCSGVYTARAVKG